MLGLWPNVPLTSERSGQARAGVIREAARELALCNAGTCLTDYSVKTQFEPQEP
jgi:hypothetical protein